jgi:hypothetical protein
MNLSTRMQFTMGIFILISAACTSAQKAVVHDVVDGVHAICEAADPALHLTMIRVVKDGGIDDISSNPNGYQHDSGRSD